MTTVHTEISHRCDLHRPVRNHYFYGKLLDAYHFELETNYFNSKRALLNRLVNGFGVVCGLDVEISKSEKCALEIQPGFAIDKHGREIIVPCDQTYKLEMPSDETDCELTQDDHGKECFCRKLHLLLCYHECLAEPAPVHTSDCERDEACEPSAIHERFRFKTRRGHIKPPCSPLKIDDLITDDDRRGGRRVDSIESHYNFCHRQLVKLISKPCADCHKDPCIPLANVTVRRYPHDNIWFACEVDIAIRPIVYNNDLLFQLLMSLIYEQPNYQNTK